MTFLDDNDNRPPVGSIIQPKTIYGGGEDCLLLFDDRLDRAGFIAHNEVGIVISHDIEPIKSIKQDRRWSMSYVKVLGPRNIVGYALVSYIALV